MLKIKVLNVSKRELFKDVDRAVEFDQSQIFKKLYENEFGTPGGEPYGALIGDYEFTNHPEDIDLLGKMSNVAAAAFCPFISAAAPEAVRLRAAGPSCPSRATWRRSSTPSSTPSGSRSATRKTRVSSRWPCRGCCPGCPTAPTTKPIEEFDYEEVELDSKGKAKPVPHEHYTWMNAAYVMGTRADRRLCQVRLLHGHPRRRRAAARSKGCRPTSSPATTATPT